MELGSSCYIFCINVSYFGDHFRKESWYITFYLLWTNTVLNIIIPIIVLSVLNIIIFK